MKVKFLAASAWIAEVTERESSSFFLHFIIFIQVK